MHRYALYLLGTVRHGKRQTPVKQTAEQQVKVGAVGLDIALKAEKHLLICFSRGVINVLHIRVIEFQQTETVVNIRARFGFYLCACPADSLFANLTNIRPTILFCFTFICTRLRKLNHNKLSFTFCFCVILHNSVSCCG